MDDMEDITKLADQSQRLSEVTVDCYNQSEELSAIEVYFTDAMHFPFAATWRDPEGVVTERRFFARSDLEMGCIRFKPDSLAEVAWGTGCHYDPLEPLVL